MHGEISWTTRKHYLLRAKAFFENKDRQVNILELGCGSGWVGQSIAGPGLRIIGTDFSSAQIELARANAKIRQVDRYCEYRLTDEADWIESVKKADGILIHAFLHHLDGRELETLLRGLRENARPGTKIWIYEPAFFQAPTTDDSSMKLSSRILYAVTRHFAAWLSSIYNRFHLIDNETEDSFSGLVREAEKNNWYLSPKEVPFNVETFSRQLAEAMEIQSQYWATVFLIGWVYHTNLLKNKGLRRIINQTFLPLFSLTDRILARETNYLKKTIVAPLYAFHVWEGIVR